MNRKVIFGLIIFAIFIVSMTLVNAEFWACFNKGEKIDYCNPKVPDRTCSDDNGCAYCMSSYNETKSCYNGGNQNICNFIPKECADIDGNTTIDTQPPKLTIYNPIQDKVYNKRAVLMDLKVDEESTLTYIDNNDGRGLWKNICRDCLSYNNSRSFKEGLNDITIKAEDVLGNPVEKQISFFVDSKKPIIKKTQPKRNSFANGEFIVTYYEENPKDIFLTYGNYLTGYRNAELSGCVGGKKVDCGIDVNLQDYDGQEIEYWFNITDIADNFDDSRHINVKVDISAPVLNSFNYTISGRYVNFNFNITEINFDVVEYYDNSALRPSWKKLCSRLDEGICEKRKSFSAGLHNLDIQITDEAGNAIGFPVEFTIG